MAIPSMATVGTQPAKAYAGQDMSPAEPTNSFMNESATAIDAGVPVARGTSAATNLGETCKPVGADADEILGPSLHYPTGDATSNSIKYERYTAVPVKASGRVAVIAGETVGGGDEVLIVVASATDPALCWGSSRGGVIGSGRIAMTGWKYCGNGTYAAGTVVEIEGRGTSRGKITT
jgi:hypothetical protein